MKRPSVSTILATILYAASLAGLGVGLWMCGSGDWRGVGPAGVGGLVWLDLALATRGPRREKPKRTA